MKIKYGRLGIVALIVYYTIKINSKIFEILSGLNKPLSIPEGLTVALILGIPYLLLWTLND